MATKKKRQKKPRAPKGKLWGPFTRCQHTWYPYKKAAAYPTSPPWASIVEDEEDMGWLADLIAAADRRQLADKRFRRELTAWTRPNASHRRDGIPGYGLGLGTVASMGAPLVIRTFDMGHGRAAHDRDLALGSPALAVLGTRDDSPAELLRGGAALARMLLLARVSGSSPRISTSRSRSRTCAPRSSGWCRPRDALN